MPIAFSRSLRALETDSFRRSRVGLALAGTLGLAWSTWFAFAHVAVVEVTGSARLEVERAAHSVEVPVAGRLTAVHLALGEEVHEGDILAELDSAALRLSANEERARSTSLSAQITALYDQIATEDRALADQRLVAQAKIDEGRARQREATTAAEFSETEAKRAARMSAEGLQSETDRLRAKAEAEQRRAAAEGAQSTIARIESEQRASETERRSKIAKLRGEAASLEGQRSMSAASIERLEHDIELRRVRAPVSGRLGDIATLRIGGVVKEGEKLGAVIPSGDVRIVADYPPASAVGRVKPGQTARMFPEGFPWTQYGSLEATVEHVASEPRSGRIRVELVVRADPSSEIPFQHGLPGTLEIEVDHVSPAVLVLRTVGSRISAPAGAHEQRRSEGASVPEEKPVRP